SSAANSVHLQHYPSDRRPHPAPRRTPALQPPRPAPPPVTPHSSGHLARRATSPRRGHLAGPAPTAGPPKEPPRSDLSAPRCLPSVTRRLYTLRATPAESTRSLQRETPNRAP